MVSFPWLKSSERRLMNFLSVPFGYHDDGDKRRKYHLGDTARLYPKWALQIAALIAKRYPRCILQIYAVIAKILFKMRIANLCCHCKNFIQNAFCYFVLSLQEFYPKCIFQSYAVIAIILFKMDIAKLFCHCKNFMQNAYWKSMLSLHRPYIAIILWSFCSK